MAQYWMSWESGADRRPRPRPDRRTLIKLGLILLALLLLLLLVLLVFLGHEARIGGNSNGLDPVALPVHAAYAFVFPDFIPGASAPGLPDLFRGTWDFLWGCSVVIRLLVLGVLPLAIFIAHRRGLRKGREDGD